MLSEIIHLPELCLYLCHLEQRSILVLAPWSQISLEGVINENLIKPGGMAFPGAP